jgi:hypothetical protein
MVLIQTLISFKAQKQGFVIKQNKAVMLFTPSQRIHRERRRQYSLTWRTEHKELKLQIVTGLKVDGIKK